MKSITEHIRHHILSNLGIEPFTIGAKGDDIWAIADHQVDWKFLVGQVWKLVMGYYRYGDNKDPHGKRHDHIERIKREVDLYLQDGNMDHLEDIANFAMLEAMKAPLGRGTMPADRVHRTSGDGDLRAAELEKGG
jgi:hypothetical protein